MRRPQGNAKRRTSPVSIRAKYAFPKYAVLRLTGKKGRAMLACYQHCPPFRCHGRHLSLCISFQIDSIVPVTWMQDFSHRRSNCDLPNGNGKASANQSLSPLFAPYMRKPESFPHDAVRANRHLTGEKRGKRRCESMIVRRTAMPDHGPRFGPLPCTKGERQTWMPGYGFGVDGERPGTGRGFTRTPPMTCKAPMELPRRTMPEARAPEIARTEGMHVLN